MARIVFSVVAVLAALPLALYGAFAILYTGDSGSPGDTYVKVRGNEIDADVAGAAAVSLAVLLLATAIFVIRRGRPG